MSFLFSGSSSPKPATPSSPAPTGANSSSPEHNTGRNVDDIARGLILAINDEMKVVSDHIHLSLRSIGKNEPTLVLSKGLAFLNTISRSAISHRVHVMNVMSKILDEQEEHNKGFVIPNDLARALVVMASAEIVADKSVNSEWQVAACRLLISLARLVPDLVAKSMLERFSSNEPPHYFVVKTLADFAHKYPILFLPHLKDILTKTLPLLAMIKHDNLRWVFAAGLGCWSEAIVVALREKATNIPKSEFSQSMFTALKHVHEQWLINRDSKVRLVSAEAMGFMCHIIETEHMIQYFPKILKDLIPIAKKEAGNDMQPVITGLYNTLFVVVRDIPEILVEHLENLLVTAHQFLVHAVRLEGKYQKADKLQLEIMKIFEVIGQKYTDQIIIFLLRFIAESKDPFIKISTLRCLKHLVINLVTELQGYKANIVSGVNLIHTEEDFKVLHEMVLLISEMGTRNYLSYSGGTQLITVVIRGASINDSEIQSFEKRPEFKQGQFTPALVRTDCDSIMLKLCSSVECASFMDPVLWPFLLEALTPEKFTSSFAVLCQCISEIAKRKKNDDDFIIDFDKAVNIPKPHAIFARLIVLLSEPFGRNNPGVNILRALYCLSPNINPDLVDAWSKRLPEMKKYLDNNANTPDTFNQDQWENHLLHLIRDSITAVQDDNWNVQVGDALFTQMPFYKNKRKMKKALLSVLGLIIQLTKLKEFVSRGVNELFNGTEHSIDEERLGCARGLGQASVMHTDIVLAKLQTIMKSQTKKATGFASFFSSAPVEVPGPKATALLAYGYVSMLTPIELFISRVDVHVIANFIPVINESKTNEVKETGIRAIDFIGKSVHPDRVQNFVLKSRDDLIRVILGIINPQDKSDKSININRLRTLGLEALTTLVSLPPRISGPIQQSILANTLIIFGLDNGDANDTLMENINGLLSAILASDPSQGTLDDILQALENYMASAKEVERKRSGNSFVFILKDYAATIAESKPSDTEFRTTGRVVGKLVARTTEKFKDVRYHGLDSIYLILRIDFFLRNNASSELPASVQKLGPLRAKLDTVDSNELYGISKELAAILCEAVDNIHISSLTQTILTSLGDVDEDGAGGACVILNGIIRIRGLELEKEIQTFVKAVVEVMAQQAKRQQIINGLQHAIRGMARHFPLPSMNALLGHKVPHSDQVKRSFQVLSTDKSLVVKLFDYLIDVLNNGQLFEERRGKNDQLETIATHATCSATCALHETLEMAEVSETAKEYYARLLCTILLRVGSANVIAVEPPAKDALVSIKNFFIVVEEEEMIEKLEKNGTFEKFVGPSYPDAIIDTLEAVCKAHPDLIKEMFDFVKPFIIRTFIGQRVAATAMIAVLLNNVKNDRETVLDAINALLGRCGLDEKVSVKIHALRGLANLTKHPKDILHRYLTPVIGALNSCLEDSDETIILESMKSIKQIFAIAEDEYVGPLLMNLCVRLKPAFEKGTPALRESSILLYGTLSRFCKGSVGDALMNNIHSNLPIIIVHLHEDNKSVINACKEALRMLAPELGSKSLVELFKQETFDSDKPIDYDKFAEEFAVVWIKDFPEHISDIVMLLVLFYKSSWDGCIVLATLITGFIIAKIADSQRKRVNLKHTCTGLVALLRSPIPTVREKAAKILGLLHEA